MYLIFEKWGIFVQLAIPLQNRNVGDNTPPPPPIYASGFDAIFK